MTIYVSFLGDICMKKPIAISLDIECHYLDRHFMADAEKQGGFIVGIRNYKLRIKVRSWALALLIYTSKEG